MIRTLLLVITLQLHHASCEDTLVDYNTLFISDSPRKGLNFTELVAHDNYKCDTHTVITSDGYILTIYHIYPNVLCTTVHAIHIVFGHGLFLSSDDCIIPGPGVGNCYLYADACFHIWVVNNRGNKYSRAHITLNPDKDPEYWKFTFDQMALYDTPAIIDFVLIKSGQSQVFYVGHSQGMTNLILLCAQKPEYNHKIKIAAGLSTATWLNYTRLKALDLQAVLSPLSPLGIGAEIFKHGSITQRVADFVCGTSDLSYPLCTFIIFALLGCNNYTITQDTLAVAVGLQPSGTSWGDFLRWGEVRRNGFSKPDLGVVGNLATYGSVKPPLYDLSCYNVPTVFVSSKNDYICDPRDLDILWDHLPNCVNCSKCILSDENFNHIDYIYSELIPELIAPIVTTAFIKGEHICT